MLSLLLADQHLAQFNSAANRRRSIHKWTSARYCVHSDLFLRPAFMATALQLRGCGVKHWRPFRVLQCRRLDCGTMLTAGVVAAAIGLHDMKTSSCIYNALHSVEGQPLSCISCLGTCQVAKSLRIMAHAQVCTSAYAIALVISHLAQVTACQWPRPFLSSHSCRNLCRAGKHCGSC